MTYYVGNHIEIKSNAPQQSNRTGVQQRGSGESGAKVSADQAEENAKKKHPETAR